jgi:putative ABC transport system permease protein
LTTLFTFGPRFGPDAEIVDAIALRVRDRRQHAALEREVRAILAERLRIAATDEEAIRMASPLDALDKLPLDQMGGLLLTLGVTTLIIGGIGVLTMMLDAVHERRQEIGVRLAVGARRRDVLVQFFLETFVITAVGGLAGLALGIAGCQALAALRVPELIPVPILRADVAALAIAVMSGVGIVAGSVPAWRAARIDPSLTLRAE